MALSRTGELFGNQLRHVRQERGLTQVQLADRCGLPQTRVSELERGTRAPNLVMVIRLALGLGCKVSALVKVFDTEDLASLLSSGTGDE